jgi:hypothetical protein
VSTPPGPLFTPPIVLPVRFRSRHVARTIFAYLSQRLTEAGWVHDPVNFGATAITLQESPPEDVTTIAVNTVAVTIGDEPADLDEQLGGGLVSVEYPVLVDVFGESYSLSQSLAADVKDALSRRVIPAYDWSNGGPTLLDGSLIEFVDVSGPRTPASSQALAGAARHWRVLTAIAYTTFALP